MWLIVLPLDVPTLTTSRLPKRSWQSEVELCRNLILDVPTFTTSRLPRDPSSQRWNYVGKKWPMNFAWNDRLPRSIQESFTCHKSTTWDRRHLLLLRRKACWGFFRPENSDGFGRVWTHELGYQRPACTSRPPKPLYISWNNKCVFDWNGCSETMWDQYCALINKWNFNASETQTCQNKLVLQYQKWF